MGLFNKIKKLTKRKKTVKKKAKKVKKQVKKKIEKKTKKSPKKQKKKTAKKKTTKKKAKAPAKKAKKTAKKKIEAPKKFTKSRVEKLLSLKDVKEYLVDLFGIEGFKIIEYLLKAGKEIDEFTLADKVKLQINFVRSLLYKLYEYKLVVFSRERDKKKGWFIYSWQARPERLKELLLNKKDEEIAKLMKKYLDEQQVFYCKECDKMFSYSEAIEHMFFCPYCGSQLEAVEQTKFKQKIKEKIAKLQKEKKAIEAI